MATHTSRAHRYRQHAATPFAVDATDKAVRWLTLSAFVGIVFLLDQVTGVSLDLSALYLIPVVSAVYWFGLSAGLATALVALVSEVLAHPGFEEEAYVHAVLHVLTYVFVAFVTSRLRTQLHRIRELEDRRDYELDLAKRLQGSEMTDYHDESGTFDVETRSIPARELGGDQLLVGETPSGLFACIADISGKGVSAALFAGVFRQALLSALEASDDPGRVIEAVNARLYGALPPETFITMLCCVFTDDRILYANAGQEPGLLASRHQPVARELLSNEGLPVGVQETLVIETSKVPFTSGDMLLCFTDGITDGPGFRGDTEGVRRFFERRDWSTAEEAADALIDRALDEKTEQRDDVTVIVVRHR